VGGGVEGGVGVGVGGGVGVGVGGGGVPMTAAAHIHGYAKYKALEFHSTASAGNAVETQDAAAKGIARG
jgi:hypothetical protein